MNAPLLLLVDDDARLRRSLSRILRRAGWHVLEAADGVEALTKMEEVAPQVLLTDMRMPRMGGMELIEAVRERNLPVPIVVLSGYHDYSVDELQDRGADAVLDKPATPTMLRETLERVASGG